FFFQRALPWPSLSGGGSPCMIVPQSARQIPMAAGRICFPDTDGGAFVDPSAAAAIRLSPGTSRGAFGLAPGESAPWSAGSNALARRFEMECAAPRRTQGDLYDNAGCRCGVQRFLGVDGLLHLAAVRGHPVSREQMPGHRFTIPPPAQKVAEC